jgi:ABC-type uncharacterized transport system involved in gliding motility auxiliary subunit
MRFGWLKARQTKYTAYLLTYLVVVLAILTAVNWLANRHNKSYDSTANKRFSLSDQTIKVVKGLKQDAKIVYFDKTSEFTRARDLLDRYNNLSTKLTVDYSDPDKKPQLAKAEGVRTYGTTFVQANGKKEEAKSLTEEEITGALIRALKGGARNVCAVSGSDEHGLADSERSGFSGVKDLMERNNYKTRSISLLEKPEVPKDCTVLVIGGPRFDYVQPAVDAIKAYVESGGRALIMLDPPLKLGKQDIGDNAAFTKLLESWGVTLNKDLVLDASGVGKIFGLGPEVPLIIDYQSHPIVREMKDIATAFPLSRSLEVKAAGGVTPEKLFATSANSFGSNNLRSPSIELNPATDKKGPLTLAAAGSFSGAKEGAQGRFVVVGGATWAANYYLPFNGNRDMFMNMMNWLSSDEDLISIRPKEPEDRRLTLTSKQMKTVFYTSVIFLPLIALASGIGVWWRRR